MIVMNHTAEGLNQAIPITSLYAYTFTSCTSSIELHSRFWVDLHSSVGSLLRARFQLHILRYVSKRFLRSARQFQFVSLYILRGPKAWHPTFPLHDLLLSYWTESELSWKFSLLNVSCGPTAVYQCEYSVSGGPTPCPRKQERMSSLHNTRVRHAFT